MQGSGWREGCNGSGGGIHEGDLSEGSRRGPHRAGPRLRRDASP